MIKELVCSDCGCEDVKILTKNKKGEKNASAIFLCFVGIVILLLIFNMFITVSMFVNISESDLSDFANYFADMKWVLILNVIGLSMSLVLILFSLLFDHKTETQVIAICPDCGKTWTIDIDVETLKEDKR